MTTDQLRIAILDTLYPPALGAIYAKTPGLDGRPYEEQLRAVLTARFGTADFYSSALRMLGWDAEDRIVNCAVLQRTWAERHRLVFGPPDWVSLPEIAYEQIEYRKPHVLFMQDLSFFPPDYLDRIKTELGCLIAGQCSCPWPGDEQVSRFDVVFTSFPHYVPKIKALGVRPVFTRLAFAAQLLNEETAAARHDIPIAFVGGFGRHWPSTVRLFEEVARFFPNDFHWYGYGLETLPADSLLRRVYCREAWGLDMYRIYARARIVLNRHGDVAEGNGNNMRQYEATGMGAALLTDFSGDAYGQIFEPESECLRYEPGNPDDLLRKIERLLRNEPERERIARAGQLKTLSKHTYLHRMPELSGVLIEMLLRAKGRIC